MTLISSFDAKSGNISDAGNILVWKLQWREFFLVFDHSSNSMPMKFQFQLSKGKTKQRKTVVEWNESLCMGKIKSYEMKRAKNIFKCRFCWRHIWLFEVLNHIWPVITSIWETRNDHIHFQTGETKKELLQEFLKERNVSNVEDVNLCSYLHHEAVLIM